MFRDLFARIARTPKRTSIEAEAERTLRSVVGLSTEIQKAIAFEVGRAIFQAIREVEKTSGPNSPERDLVMKAQMI